MSKKPLCQRYEAGQSAFRNRLGQYLAAVSVEELPRPRRSETAVVTRGYVVGFGSWFFFPALAPAEAFGRAARMSFDCHGYGVYQAAIDRQLCPLHRTDEAVLLVGPQVWSRLDFDAELELLKRFVQGAKENHWSSHWHEPTGYISERAANGSIVGTKRKSIPL
jgi:hypothetical protein